jgi:hypothetical protein
MNGNASKRTPFFWRVTTDLLAARTTNPEQQTPNSKLCPDDFKLMIHRPIHMKFE